MDSFDKSVSAADDVVAQRLKDAGKLGPHYPVRPAELVRRLPSGMYHVEGAPRKRGHFSECLLVDHPEYVNDSYLVCTCDDDSPDWTTS